MIERKSSIAAKAAKRSGDGADALLAVTGSRRGKCRRVTSMRSCGKTGSSARESSPSKKPSDPTEMPTKIVKKKKAWRQVPGGEAKADKALRIMAANAEPEKVYTLQEIAEVMGVSRERVRQIQDKALRKFRRRLWSMLKQDGFTEDELKR